MSHSTRLNRKRRRLLEAPLARYGAEVLALKVHVGGKRTEAGHTHDSIPDFKACGQCVCEGVCVCVDACTRVR